MHHSHRSPLPCLFYWSSDSIGFRRRTSNDPSYYDPIRGRLSLLKSLRHGGDPLNMDGRDGQDKDRMMVEKDCLAANLWFKGAFWLHA